MRVMTYNIRVGVETSMATIAAAVEGYAPDVLALQEVGHHWQMGERMDQAGYIAAALGSHHHVFAGALTDPHGGRFGVALVSRWPLSQVRNIKLPRASDEQRVCLVARAGEVWFACTHLSVASVERGVRRVG